MSTSPSTSIDCSDSRTSLSSDDEVFIGKLTLKEVRARLLPKKAREAKRNRLVNTNKVLNITDSTNKPKVSNSCQLKASNKVSCDFKYSENINCLTPIKDVDNMSKRISFLNLSPNDSFLKLEKQVTDCNQTIEKSINERFIKNVELEDELNHEVSSKTEHNNIIKIQVQSDELTSNLKCDDTNVDKKIENVLISTPFKNNNFLNMPNVTEQTSKEIANSNHIFKTPKSNIFIKKQNSSLTKKSMNNITYRDVSSPVAAYIKGSTSLQVMKNNTPSVPHSLKLKPHSTHIPKSVKNLGIKVKDKENRHFVKVFRTPGANTNDKKKLLAKSQK